MSVQTHLTIVVLTWMAFGLMVIRSTLQRRTQDIHHVSGWLQIFLAVMVFTLQDPQSWASELELFGAQHDCVA
ncbi:MAG: hypothetical protein OHK0046_51620 [Anaerolineae bacterium]